MIYHGKDLRKGRFSVDGQIYLVTSITLGRRPIFSDFRLGRILVNTMRQYSVYRSSHRLTPYLHSSITGLFTNRKETYSIPKQQT